MYSRKIKGYSFSARVIAVAILFGLLCVFVLIGLIKIQILDGSSLAQAAKNSRTLPIVEKAIRGRILDSTGAVLAQSVERYTLIGDPQAAQNFIPIPCSQKERYGFCHKINGKSLNVTGAAAVARLLAPVLKVNPLELGAKFSGVGRYVLIKRDVTPEVKRAVDRLYLGGIVYSELTSQRVYSAGTTIGALLGGVNDRNIGVSGIESMENIALKGTDGIKTYQQGLGGEQIPGTLAKSKPAVNGSDVTLTINSNVDWYVKKVLREGADHFHAAWAIAIVQEVGTGRILALDDSDEIPAGSDEAKLSVSRAIRQTFEPGSIGKVLQMAGMLQTGVHKLTDHFIVPNSITVDHQRYHDAEVHGAEHWTLAGILKESSNVGMIIAGDHYNDKDRYNFLHKFGIGIKSALNLPGESEGLLQPSETWDRRTRNTVLFGQGYATNILQLTNAIATIANKGVRVPQRIIQSITDAQGHVNEPSTGQPVRVVDESVAKNMLNAMESSGELYARFSGVPGYRIAAKSGTAEVAGATGRLTSIISDWSAIIPADNPRFVVTVVMKDPQGSYGGLTSGPLFAQIGQFLMQKYEIPNSPARTDAIPVKW